jgi:DNA-binding LacI/PurR family transcriptional regulator
MEKIPQRNPILTQTIEILRERIGSGEWGTFLPGEKELAQRLQVGRNTIRKALIQLTSEQLIEAGCSGKRRRILLETKSQPKARSTSGQPVIFLSPYAPDRLPSLTLRIVDEIRPQLNDAGYRLSLMTSKAFRLKRPESLLKKLIHEYPASAWILHQSTEQIQYTFQHLGLPCTILGMPHKRIHLPAISPDLAATTRHAANTLLAKGHRHICFMRASEGLAGSEQALAGFTEAFERFAGDAAYQPTVTPVEPDAASVVRVLRRMFGQMHPPTAIIVEQIVIVPTIITALAQFERRVPEHVSLVSLFYDRTLDYLIPSIAHYHTNVHSEVKRTVQAVIHSIQHGQQFASQQKLMPEFVPGNSIAAADTA